MAGQSIRPEFTILTELSRIPKRMKKSVSPFWIYRAVPIFLILIASISSTSGELLMLDRFDCTPGAQPVPTAGFYRQFSPLVSDENRRMTGGRMIGFIEEWPWSGVSQLPLVVPVDGAEIEDGRVAFRGNTDDQDRVIFRKFVSESQPNTEFFGVTLEANLIDPRGLALVAFGELSHDSNANGRAFLEGTGFTQGVAFGFQGNEEGMDLVIRFRNEEVMPVEHVLVENVEQGVPYEIVCRVEWDVITRGESPRDRFRVWVNPGEAGEESHFVEFVTTSGFPGVLTTFYLLQRRYGENLHDAIFVDDIWLGTEFADRPSSE